MKRQGFLDKAVHYLKDGGMEVEVFEGVEPDPSVETVMRGAEAMRKFEPDWIVSMGGGSVHIRYSYRGNGILCYHKLSDRSEISAG